MLSGLVMLQSLDEVVTSFCLRHGNNKDQGFKVQKSGPFTAVKLDLVWMFVISAPGVFLSFDLMQAAAFCLHPPADCGLFKDHWNQTRPFLGGIVLCVLGEMYACLNR
ncbi:hypothetical protein CHARACLAT_033600 [Characodon lateralis]|uniref:Uncharacterized protein n=1 Tax=Characodon lateralis TaxID=208331 RepID=A0ABU7F861_9TELE|nr:hypothetical protein [Characodon lateralis]